jgi:hypothetical protein
MNPQDLINGFKYFYPDTGIKVLASVVPSLDFRQLIPVNYYQNIGGGNGVPVSATKENCELLIPWQQHERSI